MKYIKPYQIFEASASAAAPALTAEQIDWLDKCTGNSWKYNPQTGLIDVDGDFDCKRQGLTDLKGVKFGKVSGDFDCRGNQLTILEGAPQTVVWGFACNGNELTSLEGAPKTVGGSFLCYNNQLTTLVGCPHSVGRNFDCSENQLTTLVGAPQTVGGGLNCKDNQLTTLVGAPKTVKGDFHCYRNQLTSLEGAPQVVGGGFDCDGNQLTSLVGAPKTVVDGSFYCGGNPVSESTLKGIFALMKKGKPYQQALEERWPKMGDEDRVLMYKQIPSLPPEDIRKYQALANYNNIKGYL